MTSNGGMSTKPYAETRGNAVEEKSGKRWALESRSGLAGDLHNHHPNPHRQIRNTLEPALKAPNPRLHRRLYPGSAQWSDLRAERDQLLGPSAKTRPSADITRELVAGGLEDPAYTHETISTAAARPTNRSRNQFELFCPISNPFHSEPLFERL